MASGPNGDGSVVLRRMFYIWRLVWTAFAFAALSVGGFILATTVIPMVTLFVHDERRTKSPGAAHHSGELPRLRHDASGAGRAETRSGWRRETPACRGKLIIANHPTLIDIVLLMALLPDTKCVVKSELFSNRLMGPVVRAAGYIRNDYEPEVLIEKCRETLEAGYNLIIFPEGTRSIPGQATPLSKGLRTHRDYSRRECAAHHDQLRTDHIGQRRAVLQNSRLATQLSNRSRGRDRPAAISEFDLPITRAERSQIGIVSGSGVLARG